MHLTCLLPTISSICFHVYFLPHTIWSSKERANITHNLTHCYVSAPNLLLWPAQWELNTSRSCWPVQPPVTLNRLSTPRSSLFLITELFAVGDENVFVLFGQFGDSQHVRTDRWKAGACGHISFFFLKAEPHQCGGRKCTMIGLFLCGNVQGTPSFALHIFTKHLPFSCSSVLPPHQPPLPFLPVSLFVVVGSSNFFIGAFIFRLRGDFIRVYNFNIEEGGRERGRESVGSGRWEREGEREKQKRKKEAKRPESLANQPLAWWPGGRFWSGGEFAWHAAWSQLVRCCPLKAPGTSTQLLRLGETCPRICHVHVILLYQRRYFQLITTRLPFSPSVKYELQN